MDNRYLREKFRLYLERNDEDSLLRFWEYAEDYKLCHTDSRQREDQLILDSNIENRWPNNYIFSAIECQRYASFVYSTFIAGNAPLKLNVCSESERNKISQRIAKAARNAFSALQLCAMRELKRIFYEDYSRSASYRDHYLAASMDFVGCYEVFRQFI